MDRNRKILTGLFVCAFLARLLYLFEMSAGPYFVSPQLDELYHDLWARQIVGFAPGNPHAEEAFFRAPLYIHLLAASFKVFGHDLYIVRFFQAALGALTVLLVFFVGRRAFSRPVALAGASLAAFWPMLIFYDGELLIPTLAVPLDLATLLLLLRWKERPERLVNLVAAGVVCGLSAIARPNILLVCPFFAGWVVWVSWRSRNRSDEGEPNGEKAGWKPAPQGARLHRTHGLICFVALTCGVLLAVLPVTARNWSVSRDFVTIASQAGVNFWIGNRPEANGFTSATPERFPFYTEYEDSVELFAKTRAELDNGGRKMKPSEISGYWAAQARADIAKEPGRVALLTLKKAILFWSAVEIANNKYAPFVARFSILLTVLLWILPFGVVAPAALARIFRQRPSAEQALLIGFIFFYMASIVPFFVCARYRMPLVPLVLLFAAQFAVDMFREAKSRSWRPFAIGATLAALFALVVWIDFYGVRQAMRDNLTLDLRTAAQGYYLSGRMPEAIALNREAIETDPSDVDCWLNLGCAQFVDEQIEEAEKSFVRVLELDPRRPSALSNLGVIAQMQKDSPRAEKYWKQALAVEPTYAPALAGLGGIWVEADRLDEARAVLERAEALQPNDLDTLLFLSRLHHKLRDLNGYSHYGNLAIGINKKRAEEKLKEWGIAPKFLE